MAEEVSPAAEAVEDAEEDKPLERFTATCLSGGSIKEVWMPETKVVSGFTFIKLFKGCLELSSESSSERQTTSQQHQRSTQELRRQACNEALRRAIVQAAEAEGSKVPGRIRRVRQEDEFIASRTVVVDPPMHLLD